MKMKTKKMRKRKIIMIMKKILNMKNQKKLRVKKKIIILKKTMKKEKKNHQKRI